MTDPRCTCGGAKATPSTHTWGCPLDRVGNVRLSDGGVITAAELEQARVLLELAGEQSDPDDCIAFVVAWRGLRRKELGQLLPSDPMSPWTERAEALLFTPPMLRFYAACGWPAFALELRTRLATALRDAFNEGRAGAPERD